MRIRVPDLRRTVGDETIRRSNFDAGRHFPAREYHLRTAGILGAVLTGGATVSR
jgi:hypothetical protein